MLVSVITNDKYLFRFIELKLADDASVIDGASSVCDVIIYDIDSGIELPDTGARVIRISREAHSDALTLPLARGALKVTVLDKNESPALSLASDGKGAILKGRYLKLTAHEFSLLSLLIEGDTEYTPRETIAKRVWGEASDGLINIYIHYLREKLETDGERIILSSRKYGYKINPAYTRSAFAHGSAE